MQRDLEVSTRAVSVVVLRRRGGDTETLLLKRAGPVSFTGAWCQVAGGIEDNERAWETALRELREETSLVPIELYSAGALEQFYDVERDIVCIVPVFVAIVDAEAPVELNHEHSQYRWVELTRVDEDLATPNQREMFAHIARHFSQQNANERSRINF